METDGPFITTGLDPMNLDIEIRMNGQRVAGYNTGKMLFSRSVTSPRSPNT